MSLETTDLRRVASALLVVFLHALVLLAFLRTVIQPTQKAAPTRELVLNFLPPSAPAKAKPAVPPAPFRLIVPMPEVPQAPGAITAQPPASNDTGSLRGLYFYLYECTPENFANLTETEKARCAQASLSPVPNDNRRVLNLPSRAKDPQHWQRALARKKNPALLPCASPQGINPIATAFCLGKAAVKGGFGDPDDGPGYGDAPTAVRDPPTGVPRMSRVPETPMESVGK